MPGVYIVILNYKNWQDTLECLESVFRSLYLNFSVIVIDNDSQNESLEHLMQWAENKIQSVQNDSFSYTFLHSNDMNDSTHPALFPRLTFIQNDHNAGYAGGVNIALRLLREHEVYVWLLNPDMVILEDTLGELVIFSQKQTGSCIIGAQVRSFSDKRQLLFYGGGRINFLSGTVQWVKNPQSPGRLDFIQGGCLFAHAANFKKYGLLPEDYFLYWEETDWCFRAKQQGAALLVCPSAVCYDKVSTVIGKGFLSDYYYCRNGLLFISKFRKRNIPIALFVMTIRWFKRIVTGQWNRARGVYSGTVDFLKRKYNEAK